MRSHGKAGEGAEFKDAASACTQKQSSMCCQEEKHTTYPRRGLGLRFLPPQHGPTPPLGFADLPRHIPGHPLALVIPLATPRQGSPLRLPHPRVRQRRLPQLAPPSDFDLVLKAVPRSAISHLKATFRSPVATFRSPVGNMAPHRGTVGSTEPRPARYHVCGWWTRGRERSTSSKAT